MELPRHERGNKAAKKKKANIVFAAIDCKRPRAQSRETTQEKIIDC